MSWLFSQALGAGYLEARRSDGVPFAPLSMSNTQPRYYYIGKIPESWKPSRYGMMSEPLTADLGAELLTWFREVFLARTFPPLEKVMESPESGPDCGVKWRELSVRYDRDTHGWKTVRSLFPEDLPWSSVTLPKWGTLQFGVLSERTTPARLTAGTGVGSWPTASARDWKDSPGMAKAGVNPDGTERKRDDMLARRVYSVTYPTPTKSDIGRTEYNAKNRIEQGHQIDLSTAVPGSLSPDWVEWLMGWPIGWTGIEREHPEYFDWQEDPADIGKVPRVCTGMKHRAARLKAIGNGQCPQAMVLAWDILKGAHHV